MYLTQFWDRDPPPAEVAELMRGQAEVNRGQLEHRRFDRASAREFIAGRLGARELAAFDQCAVPAMQADYFRYCAVLADGGFYADADTTCLSPLLALLDDDAAGVLFRRPNGNVTNGVFGFRAPGHPLLEAALEAATVAIERRLAESVWLTTGPGVFTSLAELAGMSADERDDADFPGYGEEMRAGLRLARQLARTRGVEVDALFVDVRVRPYADLCGVCTDVELGYKATDRHWTRWPGSIFSAPARAL